jgi:hypothetical protein
LEATLPEEPKAELSVTQAQYRFARALTEILVYIVVLNLFVEYVHAVVIDSFTVSVVTAVLLWLMLGGIVRLERRVASYFGRRKGVLPRVLRLLCIWAILFLSKFVILEVVAFVTAGRAVLGHFFEVVAIVLALMAAETLLGWVFRRLGEGTRSGG